MDFKFENLAKIDEILSKLNTLESKIQSPKRWLNTSEASSYLGYSKDRLYDIKDSQFIEGKHYHKKGKLLFDKYELDNWVISTKIDINPKEIVKDILKDLI